MPSLSNLTLRLVVVVGDNWKLPWTYPPEIYYRYPNWYHIWKAEIHSKTHHFKVIYGKCWGVRYFENVWTQIPWQKVQAKCPLKKNMASSSRIFGMKKHPDIWVWNHHLHPSKQRLWNIWDPRTQIVAAILWKISPIKCCRSTRSTPNKNRSDGVS